MLDFLTALLLLAIQGFRTGVVATVVGRWVHHLELLVVGLEHAKPLNLPARLCQSAVGWRCLCRSLA